MQRNNHGKSDEKCTSRAVYEYTAQLTADNVGA